MNEIHDKVISIIRKYVFNKEVLEGAKGSSKLIDDLKINSARLVDIVLDIEDEFNIEFDNQALEKILTIDDITNIINKLTKA